MPIAATYKPLPAASLIALAALLFFVPACAPAQTAPTGVLPASAPGPTSSSVPATLETPVPTSVSLPRLTLRKGDFYFSLDGRQSFLFSRNLAGTEPYHYIRQLDLAKTGGTHLVRIQLDSLGTGITADGKVDEAWLQKWELVFDQAAQRGIHVLPVFSGWFDWNNGNPDYGYSTWASNAFNTANGGPAADPGELFQPDSAAQKLWLQWLKTLVERWSPRENIAAWEIFSEVNIATGSTEANGVPFIEKAAAIVRSADPHGRPITAALADVGVWESFYRSNAIDFLSIHPYPYDVQIDLGSKVVTDARKLMTQYNKPVLIGESGLTQFLPDAAQKGSAVLPNAQLGLRHAVWAELVSGVMNGRSLYWEDGFAIFFPALDWAYLEKYKDLEQPAASFARDLDFAGFRPLAVELPPGTQVWGALIGNERMAIGWFRDAGCEPPDWPLQPAISGQTVAVTLPGAASEWRIDYYDTQTGTDLLVSMTSLRQGEKITILLPTFTGDIAFKIYPVR